MASKSTGWKCTHTASVISETNTIAVIRVTCYWENLGWSYDINYVSAWVYCNGKSHQVKNNGSVDAPNSYTKYSMGYYDFTIDKTTAKQSISCYAKITSNSSYVSGTKSSSAASVSVSAKPSYTVTYNANSGTGAPASQTKWYGSNLTLSSTTPVRTGYTFSKWNTNSSGTGTSYNSGATYSSNAALTLYAIWIPNTYTVSYNANGGSGAPGNQTKTYGSDLKLSSVTPIRTDYNFLGWSTSNNGGVVYKLGDTYKNNSSVTLYAVWELAYTKPRIIGFDVYRCDSFGTPNESGTYVKAIFNWDTDYAVSDIKIEWKNQSGDTWTQTSVVSSGTSGSINEIIGSGSISTETSYQIRAYVSDSGGDTYSSALSIGTIKYPIDVKKGGTGVSVGKAAEEDDLFDVAWMIKLRGGLSPIFLEAETDLDDVRTPNFYTGENVTSNNYSNCPLTSGTFYLEVVSCGDEGQVRQKITSCNKDGAVTYERFYYQGTWGKWHNASSGVSAITTAGTDLNDYVTTGIYYFFSDSTPLNVPSGVVNGCLVVMSISTTTLKQIWYRTGTANVSDFETYVRTCNGGTWGKWRRYSIEPVVLYEGNSTGTITLSESSANFKYLEIFYTDNNGISGGHTIVYSPNGKNICLHMLEAAQASNTYIRRTEYTISGTTITPDTTTAGYLRVLTATPNHSGGTNYIKIVRVLGHI